MRAFLAVELNDYVVNNIRNSKDELENPEFGKIKMVEDENMHLTVKFFGDINERKEKQISRCVNSVIDELNPYTGKVVGIGSFPNLNNPRVIWTTLKDKQNITTNMMKSLDVEFSNIGFKKEKSYKPHITLGRVKSIKNKQLLCETLNNMKRNYYGKVNIEKLVLKSSTLTPQGPIYKTEKEFIL